MKKIDMDNEAALDQKFDEGVEEGIKQIVISMIKEGADPIFISKITKLSLDKIKEIEKLTK